MRSWPLTLALTCAALGCRPDLPGRACSVDGDCYTQETCTDGTCAARVESQGGGGSASGGAGGAAAGGSGGSAVGGTDDGAAGAAEMDAGAADAAP